MIDDTFHLTPLDVRRYEFGKKLGGYDPDRVNQFREQVAEELERLARLNQELDAKARGFHEQLRAFRERDKAINDALVSAQQLRTDIREQAEKEAQLIVREARAEADRLLDEARSDIRRMEDQVSSLDRGRRAYLAQLRMMIERQLSDVIAAEQQAPDSPGRDNMTSPVTSSPSVSLPTPPWLGSISKE